MVDWETSEHLTVLDDGCFHFLCSFGLSKWDDQGECLKLSLLLVPVG